MTSFLERVLSLIKTRGITKNKMLRDLNLGTNSFLNWEQRGTIPGGDTLQRIANYFSVSVDYLLGKSEIAVDDSVLDTVIGEKIRRRRLYLGWTQEYLAARCEVNKSCISMWESGTTHPNAEKIHRLAEALGVEPSYFFEEKTVKNFWERFKFLCDEQNIAPNAVAEQINVSSGAVTKWKNGTIPNTVALERIAEYFGVTTDYLLGHEQSEEEPTTREEETQMKTQAKPTIDEIIESMSEMGQVEWSYLRSAMDSKFTAPREISDESRKQHEKKLERLFNALCDSVERISEGKIAAPDETKILPDLIRILKHWDND